MNIAKITPEIIAERFGPAVSMALYRAVGNVMSKKAIEIVQGLILAEIQSNFEVLGQLPGDDTVVTVAEYTISQ